jgi:chromosome segregation ATPase
MASRERAMRASIETRLALATRAADNLEQKIKDDANEIERIGALLDDVRSQLEKQQESLAALYQRTATALPAGESATLEAQIREMRERISGLTNLIGRLTLGRHQIISDLAATHRLREAQSNAVADAQFRKNSLNETRISLPPTLMPATNSTRRTRSLLLVAFAVSLLAGFGVVVMSHNMGTRSM